MKYLLALMLLFSTCAVAQVPDLDLNNSPVKELRTWVKKNPKAYKSELEDLQKVTKHYQHLLEMDDWTVTVNLVCQEEIYFYEQVPAWAFSHGNTLKKEFHIYVLTRQDYSLMKRNYAKKEHISIKTDQHASIVHEYMHLIWKNAKEEWAAEKLSKLIIVKNYKLPHD